MAVPLARRRHPCCHHPQPAGAGRGGPVYKGREVGGQHGIEEFASVTLRPRRADASLGSGAKVRTASRCHWRRVQFALIYWFSVYASLECGHRIIISLDPPLPRIHARDKPLDLVEDKARAESEALGEGPLQRGARLNAKVVYDDERRVSHWCRRRRPRSRTLCGWGSVCCLYRLCCASSARPTTVPVSTGHHDAATPVATSPPPREHYTPCITHHASSNSRNGYTRLHAHVQKTT